MKFRRKSSSEPATTDTEAAQGAEGTESATGPWDEDDLPAALRDVERADLGSLLILPPEGREVRLQVDEQTGEVASVQIGDAEGALELRAFAAPRNGSTWEEILPQLEADVTQRGGVSQRREGAWGTELLCQLTFQLPDGQSAVQASRIAGIDGGRWLLRATFLGRPAVDESVYAEWEAIVRDVVVRRGKGAMPQGAPLPLTLPPGAQRAEG